MTWTASSETERWMRAQAYAARQGCDAAAACDYADHVAGLVSSGRITLPAPHAPLYAAWLEANS